MELLNKPRPRDIAAYAVAYVFLIVTGGLAGWAAYQLRALVLAAAFICGVSSYVYPLIDRLSLLLPVIAWIIFMLYTEHHYRTAVTTMRVRSARAYGAKTPGSRIGRFLVSKNLDLLVHRFLSVAGTVVIVLALAYGGRQLITAF